MATSCSFSTSEASSKSWFRSNKLIDKYLNILDLAGFRKANTKWSNYARITYGTEGRLFSEENNGTKAVPNEDLFKQIDAKKGILYQQESDNSAPDTELENKLKNVLEKVGVNVTYLDKISDKDGNPISAVAKSDLIQGVVEVIEGKRGLNTLPEETGHIFFELLPQDHPLRLTALKKVENTEMYNLVRSQYEGVYSTEEEFKKEAIGKLIAQEILNVNKESNEYSGFKSWLKTWFDTIKSFLKSRFKTTLTGAGIEELVNPYRSIAKKILSEDVSGLRDIEEVKEEYRYKPLESYFYELSVDIATKVSAIKDRLNIAPALTRTKDGYLNSKGEVVKRVSDSVAQYYKNIFKRGIESQEFEHSRLKGDLIHKIQQTIMQDLIDGKTYTMQDVLERSKKNLLTEVEHGEIFTEAYKKYGESLFSIGKTYTDTIASFKYLENTVKAIYNNIQANQAKINEIYQTNDKAEILLEKTIYDPNRNIAGTLDIMVLYSNGAVGRYDYKSLDITEKKSIPNYKEEAWEVQLDGYTRILADAYGIDKFAESRIVPIGVKFNQGSNNPLDVLGFETANTPEEVAKKNYLSHIPLKELTVVNENVNKALASLYVKKDAVRKKLTDSEGKDKKAYADLQELNQNIKKLAFEQDYKFIIETIDDISKDFHTREISGGQNISDRYLSETLDELNLYKDIVHNLKGQFTTSEEFSKPENMSLIMAEGIIGSLITKVNNKIMDNLAQIKEGNLANPGKELGYFGRNFTQLSDINVPAFQKLTAVVRDNSNKTREHVQEIYNNINAKKNALQDLAKSRGVSLQAMYDKLIKSDGKSLSLIHEIDKSWYEDRDKAILNQDVKWLANNTQIHLGANGLEYDGDIQTRFNAFRERKVKELSETYKGKRNEQRRLEELDRFDRKFNIGKYESAIFNKDNFFVRAKEDPKYFTKEWKELILPENKALKDFYDTLVTYNREFSNITGEEDIKPSFIPRIKQDMIQRLAQNGAASVFDMKNNILNSMEVRQNDVIKGSIDPVTGEPIQSIPLLYTDNIESDSQNRDLAQNLILFADAAYSYKHLTETEHLVKNIKAIISSPEYKTILTDAFGKPLKDKTTGQILLKSGVPAEDIAAFDKYVKQIWYGQMFDNKDFTTKIMGKEVSFNKAVLKLHNFVTLKSLGLNPISSVGNAIGAYTNLIVKATEGKYFNNSNIKEALHLSYKDNEKYQAIIELFQPRANSITRELANKIAASTVERNLTMEKMLFMMKNPDEKLEDIVLLSMMQNYGIKDGKIVKTTENTLLDSFTKNDKGEYTLDIPKAELYRFRQMVLKVGTQVKGSIPQDDKMLISSSIYGYSLMFFKNWMVPLAKDKFGKLRFDSTMQEFEAGRMRIAGQQIVAGGIKDLGRMLQEFAFMGGLKKINTDIAARYLDKYIDENPDMQDMLAKGETTRSELLKQYIDLRNQKIKGAINELRLMLGWLAITMLAKAAIPDDDEKDVAKLLSQNAYMMANRGWLETSFFLSPQSANQIVTQPFVLWGLVTDIQRWSTNTFDESRDILFGEDNNNDKSPLMYYTVTRFTPFGKPIAQMTDIFDNFKTK